MDIIQDESGNLIGYASNKGKMTFQEMEDGHLNNSIKYFERLRRDASDILDGLKCERRFRDSKSQLDDGFNNSIE